jgi:glycosyltransferase involved in cell wall biosynthesis
VKYWIIASKEKAEMANGGFPKTKVLFFAWGDSIHARRRIKIFTEDPAFEVGVISTFAYEFENAKNYDLPFSVHVAEKTTGMPLLCKIFRIVLAFLICPILWCFDKGITPADCYRWIAHAQMVKDYTRQFKPDVIFLQTLLYPCYLSFFLSNKIPTIITFWNGDLNWWAKWNGIDRAFKKQLVLHGIRMATAITINSEASFKACLEYGANREKLKLIRYPGVNLDLFKPQPNRRDARERLGLRHEKVVLCPRGLGGYLNSDVIIEAAGMVIQQFPETLFLFVSGVGAESLWAEHKKRAKELGIAENIRRDGQVPWQNMPLYYNAADVFVSVSSNDSLPNCMVEAMACGVPVVMGNIPQIQVWIKNGDNGFLVPPRDPCLLAEAIVKVFNDRNSAIGEFIQKNMDLVNRKFDSRIAAASVKKLVHNIAKNQSQRWG